MLICYLSTYFRWLKKGLCQIVLNCFYIKLAGKCNASAMPRPDSCLPGFWAVATDFAGSGHELQEVLTVEEDDIDDHKMGDLSDDPNNNDPDFQPAAETAAAKDDEDHAREVEQAGHGHRRDDLHQQGALRRRRSSCTRWQSRWCRCWTTSSGKASAATATSRTRAWAWSKGTGCTLITFTPVPPYMWASRNGSSGVWHSNDAP